MIFVPIFATLVKGFFFFGGGGQIFHLVFISSVRNKVIIIVMNVLGYIYVLDPFRR